MKWQDDPVNGEYSNYGRGKINGFALLVGIEIIVIVGGLLWLLGACAEAGVR